MCYSVFYCVLLCVILYSIVFYCVLFCILLCFTVCYSVFYCGVSFFENFTPLTAQALNHELVLLSYAHLVIRMVRMHYAFVEVSVVWRSFIK